MLTGFMLTLLFRNQISECFFFEEHCHLYDSRHFSCVLQGDSGINEPTLDMILAQTLSESPKHVGCPDMNMNSNQLARFYLLPCEGMYDNVKGQISHPGFFNEDGEIKKSSVLHKLREPCNQSIFTIQHALFDDLATTKFQGGIHLLSPVDVDLNIHNLSNRPMIKRANNSYRRDGTCNVINNGMHDVSIKGVELNNEGCVDSQIPASEMAQALKNYGPDTM